MAVITLVAPAVEVFPIGPYVDEHFFANFDQSPYFIGVRNNENNGLAVLTPDGWNLYLHYAVELPILSACVVDDNTIAAVYFCMTHSDGVWHLDLTDGWWYPNYYSYGGRGIHNCPQNGKFYLRATNGLHESINLNQWTHISEIGTGYCSAFASSGPNLVTTVRDTVFFSLDSGDSWQMGARMPLKRFRFTEDGLLYGIVNTGGDQDGLWCLHDWGQSWDLVLPAHNLSAIGPKIDGYLMLGWQQMQPDGSWISLLSPQNQLYPIIHPNLSSGVKQLGNYPLAQAPSIFVINYQGCLSITDFLPTDLEEEVIPSPQDELRVFPNPSHNQVRIVLDTKTLSPIKLKVYNLKGQLVKNAFITQSTNNTTDWEWDLIQSNGRKASPGIYFIVLQDANGQSIAKSKFMVCY